MVMAWTCFKHFKTNIPSIYPSIYPSICLICTCFFLILLGLSSNAASSRKSPRDLPLVDEAYVWTQTVYHVLRKGHRPPQVLGHQDVWRLDRVISPPHPKIMGRWRQQWACFWDCLVIMRIYICLSLSIYSDNRDSWDLIGIAMVYPAACLSFFGAQKMGKIVINCWILARFWGIFWKKTSLSIQSDNLGYHLGFTG